MSRKIPLSTAYKRNYVAFLAITLFFIIVAGQLVIAAAIPLTMRNSSKLADESRKLQVISTFDITRRLCAKEVPDSALLEEQRLLAAQLDRTAIYLREYGDTLTPAEVNRLENVINRLYTVANRIYAGKGVVSSSKLNISAAVDKSLEESSKNAYK